MQRISINLLPLDFTKARFEQEKFSHIQTFGIILITLFIFVAIASFAFRFIQSQNIDKLQKQLNGYEERLLTLQKREASVVILKNRLTTISQLTSTQSVNKSMYELMNSLTPVSIIINSLIIDTNGNMLLSGNTSDVFSLDSYLLSLVNKEKNKDRISGATLENLSRGKDGIYRFSLKINAQ